MSMRDPLPRGGLIRKLWIGEAQLYREHLLRLDAASRRSRFAGTVSDEFVRAYADLSFGIDAVIHGFFVDGTLRGAAELRPLGTPPTREAEAAFSIEKPWQSHGVGSALLEHTLLAAYLQAKRAGEAKALLARRVDRQPSVPVRGWLNN